MDRFYGDMVLEPVAVTAVEKKMKEDFKKRTGQDATYFEVW